MTTRTAPGKIILFGEHAVVYGQPALAAPVTHVMARATVEANPRQPGLTMYAKDLDASLSLQHAAENGTARMAQLVLAHCGAPEPDALVTLESSIPIAGGLGSGAAVSAALGRALAAHLGCEIDDATLSALVYETEKIYHGTPSGIDNTVICYGQPIYFVRDRTIERFKVGKPFTLLIADTGTPSPTRETVGDVRQAWERSPETFNALFESIGQIVERARMAMERGEIELLPHLMNRNQALLKQVGVSSPELDHFIEIALAAGATGAKLSGGGRGGNLLVMGDALDDLETTLLEAGIVNIIRTEIR